MAEGMDLASPKVEGEFPEESAKEPERLSTSKGGGRTRTNEKSKGEVCPTRSRPTPEKEEPKSVKKRKLVLKDGPKAEMHKPKRISKRRLGREKKKGANVASETVELSSEDDDTPHNEKKSVATNDGQEDTGSPTKPGKNPQLAATESAAREEVEHPSSDPIVQEGMSSPTKPGESPVIPSSEPVQEMKSKPTLLLKRSHPH